MKPSVPGPQARGPAASGDAAWRPGEWQEPARTEAQEGRRLLEASGSSPGTSALTLAQRPSSPFPGPAWPATLTQTPVTAGRSHWPKPRVSWKRTGTPVRFLNLHTTVPACRQRSGRATAHQGLGRVERAKPSRQADLRLCAPHRRAAAWRAPRPSACGRGDGTARAHRPPAPNSACWVTKCPVLGLAWPRAGWQPWEKPKWHSWGLRCPPCPEPRVPARAPCRGHCRGAGPEAGTPGQETGSQA